METTGKLCQIEVQKTAHFILVESVDVPPQQTHNLPTALILPKESRE